MIPATAPSFAYVGDTGATNGIISAAMANIAFYNRRLTRAEILAHAAFGGVPPAAGTTLPFVSSLPSSPADGTEIYYVADAANGVVWHLKYRALDASAYKWEFIGGGSLAASVDANDGTSSTVYVDQATPGPSITVPLAGDYDVEFGGQMSGAAVGVYAYAAIKRGGAATSDLDSIAYGGGYASNNARVVRMTALAAATVLKMQLRVNASSGNIGLRYLQVRPVRVG
jgi:hypothetical protein